MADEFADRLVNILEPFKPVMGANYAGYLNHCRRVIRLTFSQLAQPTEIEREKIVIAAAFHDIGLWTKNTLDYLEPSVEVARSYLAEEVRNEWSEEIEAMIVNHHKITPYRGPYSLVEVFRKADIADFSLGLLTPGVSRKLVSELKREYANAGFHKMLVVKAIKWLPSHPLNPLPVFKW